MRKLIIIIAFLSAIINAQVIDDFKCMVVNIDSLLPATSPTTMAPNQYGFVQGGKKKTAFGVVRVPIVFVRFKDDTLNNPSRWPDYNVLPHWALTLLDSVVPANGIYENINMSNFFNRESGGDNNGTLGQFQMIGDIFYITTDNNRDYYNSYYQVNRHVLEKLDSIVDFRKYDNWRFMVNGEDYNHSYKPYNPTTGESADSVLDYIFINWREPYMPGSNLGGFSSIGIQYLSNEGVLINSGSTQFDMRDKGGEWNQSTRAIGSAHEYVHYLFGGTNNYTAHFDGYTFYYDRSINIGNISRFALMTSTEIGGMCAYEKYRLGWLQPRIVSTNSSYVPLRDTHVLNEAILVPLRYENGNLVESFLIENYQTINSYPNANPFKTTSLFNHVFTKGILVFHIENENMNYPTMTSLDIETAEGLWDWGLAAGENTPSDRSDDILIKTNSNRDSGLDERDYIPLTVGGIYYDDYLALTPSSGGTGNHGRRYDSDDWLGDPQDFFSMEYANVFTRWSNPSTVLANGNASNIGFEIIDFIDTEKKYVLNIGFDESTLLSFSPSKIQNFKVDFSGAYPVLTWEGNIEPDLLGYRVYKKLTTSSGTQTSYTFTTSTSYVDTDFRLNGIRKPFDTAEYWVVSVDNTNKLSVETEHYSTKGKSIIQWKKNISGDDLEFTFKLDQNYPNPFNPSTMIKYQLPQSAYVTLKIYDVLGNEVETLVSGYKEKGGYEIKFNAGKLSSGVYIYRIKAGSYGSIKKMTLIK